jgi:PAS domain S-box-containing protein
MLQSPFDDVDELTRFRRRFVGRTPTGENGMESTQIDSSAALRIVHDLPIPLERDVFLRTLIRELAGTLQEVVGLEEASGFVSVVGQKVGEQINESYKAALSVLELSRTQVAAVLVDLKRRIQGDFFIIEENDEKIVFGNRACPFAEKVIGRPAMCMMTSNVFGVIAAENLGYTAEEIIGNHVSMLIPPEQAEDMETILGRIRRGEKVDHYQTKRKRKDGTIIEVSLTVSPIRDEEGKIIGASKIGRDITSERRAREERERLLEATQSAKAEAETANRMKDEFLATLSHELRTPLNAIIGWAKILRTGKVDEEDMEDGLSAIERNAQVQAQLIEDLLDISRIISGNLRLEVQRLSLVDVIEAAVAAVTPAAAAKNIRIHKVLDSLAGPVIGDVARLQQVVWNLLSNAVKFTPNGGKVQVLLERVNSHVEVSVIDTGMGIKPEFLPHVFDRFRQADSSSTRRYGGLGLGLAIVKQLTEMHGGSIRAKSPGEGQGATFTVTMPIAVVHPEQLDKVRPRESEAADDYCQGGALKGLKVLVVDDEPDARQLIRRVLIECEAEVVLASSAAEALRLIETFGPHVIVSDVGMPEEDGYDFIRRVRAKRSAKELPAAALTAFARIEDRKRALRAGFQTHVAKPVDPEELTAVIASLAGRTGTGD